MGDLAPSTSYRENGRPEDPALSEPAEALAHVTDADGLLRWAAAALPYRYSLDEDRRTALDGAFVQKAEAIGADPELLLAFSSQQRVAVANLEGDGIPSTGESHGPEASA